MASLPAAESRGDPDTDSHPAATVTETAAPGINAARVIARVRWLMIVSGLTTIIAVAAVISVIGYRVFRSGGSGAAAPIDSAITLPKGAVVIASAVSEGRIVVMLDVGGATEIRTFDVKTLKQTGRITFATKP